MSALLCPPSTPLHYPGITCQCGLSQMWGAGVNNMVIRAIFSQSYVPTTNIQFNYRLPSDCLSEQFHAPGVLGEGCKIFQSQKGSSQSPSTSPGSPLSLALPIPLSWDNDCHHVCSQLSPSKQYTVNIGLLPSLRSWKMPPQLTVKISWDLWDLCTGHAIAPHLFCLQPNGNHTQYPKKYNTSESHYRWQHIVDEKNFTKGSGSIPTGVGHCDHHVNAPRREKWKEAGRDWEILTAIKAEWLGKRMWGEAVTGHRDGDLMTTTTHCNTSSKSKAYPLELNILPCTDYPLLTIHPNQTGPHSKVLDTRLPIWRKEKYIPCSIQKQFYCCIILPPHPNYHGWSWCHALPKSSYFSAIYTISPIAIPLSSTTYCGRFD